mmetsp:Transcript_36536/g.70442  ORF Transcript_36536/g.70442 Transcript_36536/m.70442 type:complete len:101 (-) Transcript_36536:58-360(-)
MPKLGMDEKLPTIEVDDTDEQPLPEGLPSLQKIPSLSSSRSTEPLTEEQIKEYKEAWKLFDADQDGYISASELERLMRSTGHSPSQEELERIIHEADEDG